MATRSAALVLTRDLERSLHQQGHQVIVGIDEVGKGSWAGPLAVGVAVLPLTGDLAGVRDSKSITEKTREAMFETVGNWCTSWAVGYASHLECDALGMADAQRLATKRARTVDRYSRCRSGRWQLGFCDTVDSQSGDASEGRYVSAVNCCSINLGQGHA